MIYEHCDGSSVISTMELLLFYQVILAHLVLKRILEYLLGNQKNIQILKVTIRLNLKDNLLVVHFARGFSPS